MIERGLKTVKNRGGRHDIIEHKTLGNLCSEGWTDDASLRYSDGNEAPRDYIGV